MITELFISLAIFYILVVFNLSYFSPHNNFNPTQYLMSIFHVYICLFGKQSLGTITT